MMEKFQFLQEPYGVTSQKTSFFIVTAVKTSNLTRHVSAKCQNSIIKEEVRYLKTILSTAPLLDSSSVDVEVNLSPGRRVRMVGDWCGMVARLRRDRCGSREHPKLK
jgi:hypothetical protein